ncbi:MAG: hypothetical protein AAFR96_10065 [Planctomycetota bacterium]
MTGLWENTRGIPAGGEGGGDGTDGSPDRYDLQERYLDLVRSELPHRARSDSDGPWPITEDHCFMRIVLDALFGGCWYDHIDRRLTAYKQLNNEQLLRAIEIAESMLREGPALAERLNEQSLRWRAESPGAQALAEKRSFRRKRVKRKRPPSPEP